MYREFIITADFDKYWRIMGLSDEDLRELQNVLLDNPKRGQVIRGTGGLRKLRMSALGHGKRGGARVIYLDNTAKKQLFLFLVYPKNKKDEINAEDRRQLTRMATILKGTGND